MNFITGKVIEKCLKKLLVVTLVASLWKEQNLQSFIMVIMYFERVL